MASDLTPEYAAVLRSMTGEEKIRAAFALWASARRLKTAALRLQHPSWTAEEIEAKVSEIFLYASD